MGAMFGVSVSIAGEAILSGLYNDYSYSVSASVNIPTGVFFNGSNFVKVESTWVGIFIGGGSRRDLSIKHAEIDPYGNYAIVLEGGESITIYSNGRSLIYNGTTYSKK